MCWHTLSLFFLPFLLLRHFRLPNLLRKYHSASTREHKQKVRVMKKNWRDKNIKMVIKTGFACRSFCSNTLFIPHFVFLVRYFFPSFHLMPVAISVMTSHNSVIKNSFFSRSVCLTLVYVCYCFHSGLAFSIKRQMKKRAFFCLTSTSALR